MFVFGRVSLDRFYVSPHFSIVMMNKDLNHLNPTYLISYLELLLVFFNCSYLGSLCGHRYSSHASEFPLLGMKASDCSATPVPAGLS